ncbi:hypothetical protein CEXT_286941 [Caerostris extrusa]|uniref:Uncharacterized protein n=1 Tax=Caerostris extrusa TaxID=172846 RepID=A0AAV4U6G4_CAEEX|nr:hypothetical protein CEXT_286941 [Caerostris extrusa]
MFYHECSIFYDLYRVHPLKDISEETVKEKTDNTSEVLRSQVFYVVKLWEHEFTEQKYKNPHLKNFLGSHSIQNSVNPREHFAHVFRSCFLCVHCNHCGVGHIDSMEKKYSRFVPDNKHSVFKMLVDVMDSILFVTSGKKNALHLSDLFLTTSTQRVQDVGRCNGFHLVRYIWKEERLASLSQWKERRKLLAVGFQSSMLKGYLTVFNEHAQKWVKFLHEETGNEFTCVESPISLCSLDIVCDELNVAENQV